MRVLFLSLFLLANLPRAFAVSTVAPEGSPEFAFMELLREKKDGAALEVLEAHPQLIEWKDDKGLGSLHWAVLNGLYEVASYLIGKGVDVDGPDDRGRTPLHLAVQNADENISSRLMRAGADLNAVDGQGMSPLDVAFFHGYEPIAKLLLESGVTPDWDSQYIKKYRGSVRVIFNSAKANLDVLLKAPQKNRESILALRDYARNVSKSGPQSHKASELLAYLASTRLVRSDPDGIWNDYEFNQIEAARVEALKIVNYIQDDKELIQFAMTRIPDILNIPHPVKRDMDSSRAFLADFSVLRDLNRRDSDRIFNHAKLLLTGLVTTGVSSALWFQFDGFLKSGAALLTGILLYFTVDKGLVPIFKIRKKMESREALSEYRKFVQATAFAAYIQVFEDRGIRFPSAETLRSDIRKLGLPALNCSETLRQI